MLLPTQRRQRILADIDHSGMGTVIGLSEKYGVSEMTIRRDLKALAEDGHIKRTHGGAVRQQVSPVELHIVAREKRQKLWSAQKARIADFAARDCIADGDVIIMEGGTTVTMMAQYLADKQELTVVTNGLATTSELQRFLPSSATIICAGGILRAVSSTFVGPVAERFFREFHANKLFLSATGLTLAAGVTDPNMLETQVKRAMIASASQVIVLLDSSKFGVKSLMTVLDLDEIDLLITDEATPPDMVEGLKARGVDVCVAP
jgi:DeoR/GlpR family transcriptional regulator of sugar metabolism